jgi:hypothetical protein
LLQWIGENGVKTIGVLFGMENSFPGALVERINSLGIDGIRAEFVEIGAVRLDTPLKYSVIVDRISHDVPFYRAFLKHATLQGTYVINNSFWWSADDKFFNYALAEKLGVAVPRTAILPHKQHPVGTTDRSMRNLEYPLKWDELFDYIGFPSFLKPVDGGGWKDVFHIHNRDEFFNAYDQSRDLCMTLQTAVKFKEYFRCYVVGQEHVRIMPYDPRRPHAERYVLDPPEYDKTLIARVKKDAVTLCKALGYDLNTVEFAVEDGIPYAIDFMNPAPDADLHAVGAQSFEWIVSAVAELAVKKAKASPYKPELRWAQFLGAAPSAASKKKSPAKKASAKKTAAEAPTTP